MVKSDKIWDLIANNYDKGEKNFEPIHIKTVENTKQYLNRDDIVLDYGCGTGTKAFELAGDVKKVHGIDISFKMIEIAKRKTIERNTPNVDFGLGTIFDKGLEKGSFDVILAFNILHYLKDTRKAIQRINELLKPGGFFISSTECMGEEKKSSRIFSFLALFLLTKARILSVRFFKISELEALIADGNFHIAKTERLNLKQLRFYFVVAKKI